jgi:hypothetical protein
MRRAVPESPPSENPPPLGTPIYDDLQASDGDRPGHEEATPGEHVVITPQTAGSAGAAHPQES